jgi:hypothetical protein
MNETIERHGVIIGTVTKEFPQVRVFRAVFKPGTKPVYRATLLDGQTTQFTFSSRKQAIEWLEQAR